LFVAVLERLTLRRDLRHLTMLPWRSLFPPNGHGLLARCVKWCPKCLSARLAARVRPYRPLIWSLDMTAVCEIHNTLLVDTCPHCGRGQPHIPRMPFLDRCAHCLGFLGGDGDKVLSGAALPYQTWLARAGGDLVKTGPDLPAVDLNSVFREHLQLAIDDRTKGNCAEFCRRIGMAKHMAKNWFAKSQRPSLPSLLAVCYGLNDLPSELLGFKLKVVRRNAGLKSVPAAIQVRAKRPKLTSRQRDRLAVRLREARSTFQTLTSVCADSEITRSAARYWCSKECDSLRAATQLATQQRRRQRAVDNREIFCKAIAELHNSGAGLSRRRIERQLKMNRRSLLQPEMRELYRDALQNPDEYLPPKICTASRSVTRRIRKSNSRPN
jgi:hypothetical protein